MQISNFGAGIYWWFFVSGTPLGDAIQAFGDLQRDGDYTLWDGGFTVKLGTFSMGMGKGFRTLDFVESENELSQYRDYETLVTFLTLAREEITSSLDDRPKGP